MTRQAEPPVVTIVWIPAHAERPDVDWPGEWQPNDLWYSEAQLCALCDFATLLDVIAPQAAHCGRAVLSW